MYKKLVIGIDQSYQRTGISIAADGKLLLVKSIDLSKLKSKTEKRVMIKKTLQNIIVKNMLKAHEIVVIVERIRTISQGRNQSQGFGLKPDYLKSIGALTAIIVDTAFCHNICVYSVDTRSWKSKVLGSSKDRDNRFEKPEKAQAIKKITKMGFDLKCYDADGNVKKHTKGQHAGKILYDDDAADSACIALYGFCSGQNLKLEE